jgi:hypothetical protein
VHTAIVTTFAFSSVCLLLFLCPFVTSGPACFMLFLFASFSFLAGFALCSDGSVSAGRRFAIAYLACVAWAHLWTAALVFKDTFAGIFFIYDAVGAIESLIWSTSKYGSERFSVLASWHLSSGDTFRLIAAVVIVVAMTSLLGTIGMARKKKAGYSVWVYLIAILGIAAMWVPLDYAISPNRPHSFYGIPDFGPPIWWPLFWPVSCGAACWIAWKGMSVDAR